LAERASQDAAATGALHEDLVRSLERAAQACEALEIVRNSLDASGSDDVEPQPDTSPGEHRFRLAVSHSA